MVKIQQKNGTIAPKICGFMGGLVILGENLPHDMYRQMKMKEIKWKSQQTPANSNTPPWLSSFSPRERGIHVQEALRLLIWTCVIYDSEPGYWILVWGFLCPPAPSLFTSFAFILKRVFCCCRSGSNYTRFCGLFTSRWLSRNFRELEMPRETKRKSVKSFHCAFIEYAEKPLPICAFFFVKFIVSRKIIKPIDRFHINSYIPSPSPYVSFSTQL